MTTGRRPAVFGADLARVIRCLEAPPELWPEIADALGLRLDESAFAGVPPAGTDLKAADHELRDGSDDVLPARSRTSTPAVAAHATLERPVRPSALRLQSSPSPAPPLWLTKSSQIPRPAEGASRRMPPESLLVESWSRGILAAMLSTEAASGEFDMQEVVGLLARARPLAELPRRVHPTLARGAQVCVDVAGGMLPFAHDERALVTAVGLVMGGSPFDTLYFAGCPARAAGPADRDTWEPYAAPAAGRPVLLITDLGIGRPRHDVEPALPGEWVAFLRDVAHSGCPAVALIPYPPDRVPRRIRPLVHVVTWDRSTSVRTLRQALGVALGVP